MLKNHKLSYHQLTYNFVIFCKRSVFFWGEIHIKWTVLKSEQFVAFSRFIMLCKPPLSSSLYCQSIIITPKGNPEPIEQLFPVPSFPASPWQPSICFLSLWIYVVWIFHISRVTEYVTFFIWFLSPSIMFLRFIYLAAWIRTSVHFMTE